MWATTLQENSNVVRKKQQQLSDQSSTEDSKHTFNINFLLFISHLIPLWLEEPVFILHNFYLTYTFIHCFSYGLRLYQFNNNIYFVPQFILYL